MPQFYTFTYFLQSMNLTSLLELGHMSVMFGKKAQISNLIETKIDSGYKVKNRTQSFNMYTIHKVK